VARRGLASTPCAREGAGPRPQYRAVRCQPG
jgi:hypothetical protein